MYVIEMSNRDQKKYGLVHESGCTRCYDPLDLGTTFDEVMDNWPWHEELDQWFVLSTRVCPCAKGLLE